jgi:hypothetical protein
LFNLKISVNLFKSVPARRLLADLSAVFLADLSAVFLADYLCAIF